MTLEFLIQGSAADPYRVVFQKNDSNLSATCTCPAGENGTHCKHRLEILRSNTKGIVSGNPDDVRTVVQWLEGTPLEQALAELAELERRMDQIKKLVSGSKKKLARILNSP